jgi:hypothetical protein
MATTYTHKLAYRHDNGEVEGFVGTAFHQENARRATILKIIEKVVSIGRQFHPGQVIESVDGLTPNEIATIQSDWKIGT